MKKIIINFVVLIISIVVFVMISSILSQRIDPPAWMPFDFHDGPWLAALLKFFGVIVILPPFANFLASLFSIGSERSRLETWREMHGDSWTLRLSKGMKWSMVGMSIGLAGAIIFALWVQNEPLGIWIYVSPLLLMSFYCGLVFLTIHVKFDRSQITSMTMRLSWETHAWDNLVMIEHVPSWTELRLHFSDGRFARVSTLFIGVGGLLTFAEAKVKENAALTNSEHGIEKSTVDLKKW